MTVSPLGASIVSYVTTSSLGDATLIGSSRSPITNTTVAIVSTKERNTLSVLFDPIMVSVLKLHCQLRAGAPPTGLNFSDTADHAVLIFLGLDFASRDVPSQWIHSLQSLPPWGQLLPGPPSCYRLQPTTKISGIEPVLWRRRDSNSGLRVIAISTHLQA